MLGHRRDIARLRSDFYRDQYRRILHWLIMAVGVIFVLLAAIIYLILFQAPQQYYANTTEGKILLMPPRT